MRLSVEAITAFSLKPLRVMSWAGTLVVLASMALMVPLALNRLSAGAGSGYALLACGLFFMGGVQLVMLGVMAHYLGQIFQRAQNRPMYIVMEESGAAGARPEVVVPSRRPEVIRSRG